MSLIFASVDGVVLRVGVLENIVVARQVGGLDIANDGRGVGLLSPQSGNAKEWH